MRPLRPIVLVFAMLLAVAACGDDDTSIIASDDTSTTEAPADDPTTTSTDTTTTTTEPPRAAYTAGFEVDYDTGNVDISAYDAFLAEHGAPPGGAEGAALEFLGEVYGEVAPAVSSIPADGGRIVVTVEYTDLPDDSVEAERFEIVFVGDTDDLFVESGSWASRCQAGRGHQDFQVALCV
jgi:hypothetical protein